MSDLDRIRKFEYRPSRMKSCFEIDFIAEIETFHGICTDISAEGIRAEFDGFGVVGSSGVLILHSPSGVLNVDARVTYAEKGAVGLVFRFKTPLDRGMATRFIAAFEHYSAGSRLR